MTSPTPVEVPAVVIRRSTASLRQLREGSTIVSAAAAVFRVEGPGAVDCLQGVLSNDLVRPGPETVIYAATLTSKGMILADFWVLRDQHGVTLVTEPSAREPVATAFARQLPPRLAKLSDRTDTWRVTWLLGARTATVIAATGLPWPMAGHVAVEPGIPGPLLVGHPAQAAPWQAIIIAPSERGPALIADLEAHGGSRGAADDLEAERILRGWPRLGAEIGEKTLPQEVRYDELGGVSYTKGCYTGQETVARLHFRGRPNWLLRGLTGSGTAPVTAGVTAEDRDVGMVHSVLELETGWLATASLRREVEPGTTVLAGGHAASVVALPFEGP